MRRAFLAAGLIVGAWLAVPLLVNGAAGGDVTVSQQKVADQFRQYLAEDWKQWMEEYPDFATQAGYPGQNRRWPDDSPAGIEKRKRHLAASLAKLKQISRDALPENEYLNYDLYRELLE